MNTALATTLLPTWLRQRWADDATRCFKDVEARAAWVIALSQFNVAQGTGGPFAAAVFDAEQNTLIAVGVNRVVPLNASAAHAEMVAITLAQHRLQSFDLGAANMPVCELVTSTEPCAMCFGALPWSGIRQLVCCAHAEDATAIGFDEGPRHPDWITQLEQRGMQVTTSICRDQAAHVLQHYQQQQGTIYNARQA
jgi:tRNA(Arg) A34 adenosine deaminase TadA